MMDDNSPDPIALARSRRAFVTLAARRLRSLGGTDECLRALDRDVLAALPRWCLMEDGPRERLQHLCGAFYLAPLIRGTLHGEALRAVATRLGPDAFDAVMRREEETPSPCRRALPGDPVLALGDAGGAVLLGTLDDARLAAMFAALTGRPESVLPAAVARPLYADAARVQDALEGRLEGAGEDEEPPR